MKAINNAPDVPKPVGAYSQAIETDSLVFTAGQIGLDPASGEFIGGDIESQTHQVMKNICAVLQFSGSHIDQVAMTTIFLSDISYGKTVNAIYSQYVNEVSPPARQTVAVKELPMGALVEISVIAVKG